MNIAVRLAADAADDRIDEDWGSLTWLASQKLENAVALTLGRVVIRKDMSNPPHSHPTCEEVLYLLRGELEHVVGNYVYILKAGDTLTVDAGVPHCATSIGDEDADMIVVYSSGTRDFKPEP